MTKNETLIQEKINEKQQDKNFKQLMKNLQLFSKLEIKNCSSEMADFYGKELAKILLKLENKPETMQDVKKARKLIENGANLNTVIDKNSTMLIHQSACNNNLGIMYSLLEAGVNPNTKFNYLTPLHWACGKGSYECAKLLIDFGANVNLVDAEGQDALVWANKSNNKSLINMIEKIDCDENPQVLEKE